MNQKFIFRFTLNLSLLNVYCNDDCTTTFVAIAVPDIYCTPLKTLVEKLNTCLGEYKLPFFYEVSVRRLREHIYYKATDTVGNIHR